MPAALSSLSSLYFQAPPGSDEAVAKLRSRFASELRAPVRRSEGLCELAATDLTPRSRVGSRKSVLRQPQIRCNDFLPGLTFPRLAESVVLHLA